MSHADALATMYKRRLAKEIAAKVHGAGGAILGAIFTEEGYLAHATLADDDRLVTFLMDKVRVEVAEEPDGYMPSNDTEGMIFMEQWCDRCKYDDGEAKFGVDPKACPILERTLCNAEVDEWLYTRAGKPMCTGFEEDE